MTLRLRVPAVSDQVDTSVETRRVYVEEWIESLPFADPPRLMEDVCAALTGLNRSPLKFRTRLELLELYITPYQYLLDLIRGHGAARTIASFEKHRGETDATRQIAGELAYGYKLVLSDTLGSRMRAKKEIATALQRAVTFLSHVLLHSYHEYLPTPDGIWTELAELYVYSTSQNTDKTQIPRRDGEQKLTESVDATYKTILVTALLDPYHLAYGDTWRVESFIAKRVRGIQLLSAASAEVNKTAGIFHISPDQNQRAVPYPLLADRPRDGLLLNTRPLLSALQHRLDELLRNDDKGFGLPDEAEARFTTRILLTLGRPPTRTGERDVASRAITLTTGLSTVHHFLSGKTEPETVTEDPSTINVTDVRPGQSTNFSQHTYTSEQWIQTNHSGGGVGIFRPVRPNHIINVGDFVGLQAPESAEWSIGILRWLTVGHDGSYQAGVEFRSRGAKPIVIQASEEKSETNMGVRLSASKESEVTIAIPSRIFQTGLRLFVKEHRRSYELKLKRKLEALVACDIVTGEVV